jgi:hypothetical protein
LRDASESTQSIGQTANDNPNAKNTLIILGTVELPNTGASTKIPVSLNRIISQTGT